MHPFIIVSIIGLVVAVPGIGSEVTFPARSYSGEFSESCYHLGIKSNTWTLQSICANNTGTEAAASLDLSRCLGVGAGDVLVCDPGMPDASGVCTKPSFTGGSLISSICTGKFLNYDLDGCVTNTNGVLNCNLSL